MHRLEWRGLYNESWQGDIVPEAYAHPAKYGRGLVRQIYRHMLDSGMVAAGDVIGDPFGGVGCGALDAMLNGLHWRGVELEPRFVTLAQQNIALWNDRYAPHMPRWGTAAIVQGDSRRFAELVGGLGAVASSPPYIDAVRGESTGIDWNKAGRPDRMKPSEKRYSPQGQVGNEAFNYGSTPGQLGSMPAGDLDAVASSPPYASGTLGAGDGPNSSGERHGRESKTETAYKAGNKYGGAPGNLDNLPVGDLDAVASSPPFEASLAGGKQTGGILGQQHQGENKTNGGAFARSLLTDYGVSDGNIGNDQGDTFWQASRAIMEQVYLSLKPGGYAAWVTGDFVRKGKRVYFGRQWLALCEAVGFEPVAWAIAWKTECHGTQTGLFGDVERRTDRVSFFRRLANERNPDAAILNEDVVFVRKPDGSV